MFQHNLLVLIDVLRTINDPDVSVNLIRSCLIESTNTALDSTLPSDVNASRIKQTIQNVIKQHYKKCQNFTFIQSIHNALAKCVSITPVPMIKCTPIDHRPSCNTKDITKRDKIQSPVDTLIKCALNFSLRNTTETIFGIETLLIKIFQNLDFKSICNCRSVNQEWLYKGYDIASITNVKISDIGNLINYFCKQSCINSHLRDDYDDDDEKCFYKLELNIAKYNLDCLRCCKNIIVDELNDIYTKEYSKEHVDKLLSKQLEDEDKYKNKKEIRGEKLLPIYLSDFVENLINLKYGWNYKFSKMRHLTIFIPQNISTESFLSWIKHYRGNPCLKLYNWVDISCLDEALTSIKYIFDIQDEFHHFRQPKWEDLYPINFPLRYPFNYKRSQDSKDGKYKTIVTYTSDFIRDFDLSDDDEFHTATESSDNINNNTNTTPLPWYTNINIRDIVNSDNNNNNNNNDELKEEEKKYEYNKLSNLMYGDKLNIKKLEICVSSVGYDASSFEHLLTNWNIEYDIMNVNRFVKKTKTKKEKKETEKETEAEQETEQEKEKENEAIEMEENYNNCSCKDNNNINNCDGFELIFGLTGGSGHIAVKSLTQVIRTMRIWDRIYMYKNKYWRLKIGNKECKMKGINILLGVDSNRTNLWHNVSLDVSKSKHLMTVIQLLHGWYKGAKIGAILSIKICHKITNDECDIKLEDENWIQLFVKAMKMVFEMGKNDATNYFPFCDLNFTDLKKTETMNCNRLSKFYQFNDRIHLMLVKQKFASIGVILVTLNVTLEC